MELKILDRTTTRVVGSRNLFFKLCHCAFELSCSFGLEKQNLYSYPIDKQVCTQPSLYLSYQAPTFELLDQVDLEVFLPNFLYTSSFQQ